MLPSYLSNFDTQLYTQSFSLQHFSKNCFWILEIASKEIISQYLSLHIWKAEFNHMKYDILLESQGHGSKNGGRGKAKRNKSRSNTTVLCAAPPVRVMMKAQVLWQVWHTFLRKVCTENLHIWTVIAQDLYGVILSCLELALLHYWKLCHLASL